MDEKQLEILGLLQEECAEIIQAASKIRRFGLDSYNPYDPKKLNNRILLEDEMGDARLIIQILEEMGMVRPSRIQERIHWKRGKLIENGILEQPQPITEVLTKLHDTPGWSELSDSIEADRRRLNILSDISIAADGVSNNISIEISIESSFASKSRQHLIRKAAEILLQLERLPNED